MYVCMYVCMLIFAHIMMYVNVCMLTYAYLHVVYIHSIQSLFTDNLREFTVA